MSDHPICHVEIPAIDPAAAGTFYAEVFGWQMEVDPTRNYHMFQPQSGPGGAFVGVGETTGTRIGEVLIYVFTNDIDATLAHAEALGAKTLTPKTEVPHGWFAVFADPSGNRCRPGDSSALSRPGAQTRLGRRDQLQTRRPDPSSSFAFSREWSLCQDASALCFPLRNCF